MSEPPWPQPLLHIPIARQPFDPAWDIHSLEQMNIQCPSCHALHWRAEALSHSSNINPKFGMCCYQGKISLPDLQKVPHQLYQLFTRNDPLSSKFHQDILFDNNSLAMTSVGKTTVNQGAGGPYSFVLRGELIHQAGSILSMEGRNITYSQLYIHDTEHALQCRMARHDAHNSRHCLNPLILNQFQGILHQVHPAICLYEQAFALTITMPPD
jgi:hypothetical protein